MEFVSNYSKEEMPRLHQIRDPGPGIPKLQLGMRNVEAEEVERQRAAARCVREGRSCEL